ncbi:unnamed protein product [Pieris brassicae]|uniref:Uncharacterized protein n=1 Tax=Pieris brassicae TaxID=7116 RepID=A0A9P0SQU0_PIEBR|nr:unnamed protein product [Pieris brassicae]
MVIGTNKYVNACTEGLRSTSESKYVQSDNEEPTQIQMKTPNTETKRKVTIAVDYGLLSKTCDRCWCRCCYICNSTCISFSSNKQEQTAPRMKKNKRRYHFSTKCFTILFLSFDGRKDQT